MFLARKTVSRLCNPSLPRKLVLNNLAKTPKIYYTDIKLSPHRRELQQERDFQLKSFLLAGLGMGTSFLISGHLPLDHYEKIIVSSAMGMGVNLIGSVYFQKYLPKDASPIIKGLLYAVVTVGNGLLFPGLAFIAGSGEWSPDMLLLAGGTSALSFSSLAILTRLVRDRPLKVWETTAVSTIFSTAGLYYGFAVFEPFTALWTTLIWTLLPLFTRIVTLQGLEKTRNEKLGPLEFLMNLHYRSLINVPRALFLLVLASYLQGFTMKNEEDE